MDILGQTAWSGAEHAIGGALGRRGWCSVVGRAFTLGSRVALKRHSGPLGLGSTAGHQRLNPSQAAVSADASDSATRTPIRRHQRATAPLFRQAESHVQRHNPDHRSHHTTRTTSRCSTTTTAGRPALKPTEPLLSCIAPTNLLCGHTASLPARHARPPPLRPACRCSPPPIWPPARHAHYPCTNSTPRPQRSSHPWRLPASQMRPFISIHVSARHG